ncbi:tight adherence protein B [Micrococcales bacterium KH10]|nr:tight adherence protein B [Micrococcales bacterium KH10]
MAKKEIAPQLQPSLLNTPAYNYRVYHFGKVERIATFIVTFGLGAFVGYTFFGGLAVDQNGEPTTATTVINTIVILVFGLAAARILMPIRANAIRVQKQRQLKKQFGDFLASLTSSLSAGGTIVQALDSARSDLEQQHNEDAPIVHEIGLVLAGFHNNVRIEDMLHDFGERSGVDDIQSFATVFRIAYERGGDMKEVVRNTNTILSEKMYINDEIETSLSGSKYETLIMAVLPVVLVAMIKGNGSTFGAALSTPIGIMCTFIALTLFVIAFLLARKIMTIKI